MTAAYDFTAYPDGRLVCRLGHEIAPGDTDDHLHREPVDNSRAFGLGRLLDAVESLPPRHDCPEMPPGIFRRLLMCNRHPRWHVLRIGDRWEVYPPAGSSRAVPWYGFTSHAAAIRYATKRARAEQLAAIQDGGAGR